MQNLKGRNEGCRGQTLFKMRYAFCIRSRSQQAPRELRSISLRTHDESESEREQTKITASWISTAGAHVSCPVVHVKEMEPFVSKQKRDLRSAASNLTPPEP